MDRVEGNKEEEEYRRGREKRPHDPLRIIFYKNQITPSIKSEAVDFEKKEEETRSIVISFQIKKTCQLGRLISFSLIEKVCFLFPLWEGNY